MFPFSLFALSTQPKVLQNIFLDFIYLVGANVFEWVWVCVGPTSSKVGAARLFFSETVQLLFSIGIAFGSTSA